AGISLGPKTDPHGAMLDLGEFAIAVEDPDGCVKPFPERGRRGEARWRSLRCGLRVPFRLARRCMLRASRSSAEIWLAERAASTGLVGIDGRFRCRWCGRGCGWTCF